MNLQLDDWQQKVLETEGNICVRAGRQVGKSTVISIKAAEYAVYNSDKNILVIAAVERQAELLFDKILNYLIDNFKSYIKKGKEKPTKHKVLLTNGSAIYCLPTGLTGYGIRGYTISLLIADEAAFIPNEVFVSTIPSLAVSKGTVWLLSTPHGKEGYYYKCFEDENFKHFHISSEDCPRKDIEFLKKERERMTKAQYAQEYLGEFIDELRQFFSSDLIKKSCCLQRVEPSSKHDKFMGVDVARLGEDETVLISVERIEREKLKMFDLKILKKKLTTETTQEILWLDAKNNYKKIYIDDGGLGVAVFDPLLANDQTKRKVVAINNSSRPLDRDERQKRKLLKEDLYNNLVRLMEQGKIELFDNDELALSLRSIQYEYDEKGNLKIFGNYTHITEALIRAAWCIQDKTLNIWIR